MYNLIIKVNILFISWLELNNFALSLRRLKVLEFWHLCLSLLVAQQQRVQMSNIDNIANALLSLGQQGQDGGVWMCFFLKSA